MSRTLTISDTSYERLEIEACRRGLKSVESLLDQWRPGEDEFSHRQEAVLRIDALRESLTRKYGEVPDSTDFIREDRAR